MFNIKILGVSINKGISNLPDGSFVQGGLIYNELLAIYKMKIKIMIKKILIGLAVLLVNIQFYRPSKNLSDDTSNDISMVYTVPDDVKAILQRSCNDCHSNKTVYPWYAEVQPVEWWLNDHIVDGKRHFNLNNFTAMKAAVQKKKMEECMEQIKKNEMPLNSYTWIHKDAILSEADKQTIYTWCRNIIDTLKAKYPPDSLILKQEKGRG
jgi:hypothetical protein